ncbi:hypothetical protein BKA66DRAFT_437617 [Pyrenochaeta sp. MPI-SDFR-AT-0127]|nr:hypothetical protein BKA66DRAFT_437617 [Pyrenochaeta sp. MPI-SDFR-AT-0127]
MALTFTTSHFPNPAHCALRTNTETFQNYPSNISNQSLGNSTYQPIQHFTDRGMHPALIIVLLLGALLETWVIFAITYAALKRYDGRGYIRRVKDTLKFKISYSGFHRDALPYSRDYCTI